MSRRTKIIATVGPQRSSSDENRPDDLLPFEQDGTVPRDRMLRSFIEAGADIVRVNMAFATKSDPYGDNERHYLTWLIQSQFALGKPVAVIGDLPGPKVRLGEVSLAGTLTREARFTLGFGAKRPSAPGACVLVNNRPFAEAVAAIDASPDIADYLRVSRPAQVVLSLGDGKVELSAIQDLGEGLVDCVVRSETVEKKDIASGKGLTITRVTQDLQVEYPSLAVDAFQEADQKALDFLLTNGTEILAFVAVSFAQTRRDILKVKYFIETHPVILQRLESVRRENPRASVDAVAPGVIAKIETRRGWENIDEILDVVDGIMVARGDLGEQLPAQDVPEVQKSLIRKCNVRGKPVITATQMLDSMEKKPSPTRAEAADVFNAILDGTDAVMLSGETSIGTYPLRAIRKMAQIAEAAESYYFKSGQYYFMRSHRTRRDEILEESRMQVAANTARLEKWRDFHVAAAATDVGHGIHRWAGLLYRAKVARSRRQPTTDRICEAACGLSESGEYRAILVPTTSGRTAFMISRFRPVAPVVGAAHFSSTYRKLILGFGIRPVLIGSKHSEVGAILLDGTQKARQEGLLIQGDEIVATSGTPLYEPGTTNLVQILKVS